MSGHRSKIVLYGAPVLAFADRLKGRLPQSVEIVSVDYDASLDEVGGILNDADVLVANRFQGLIGPFPHLKLIQAPGAGLDEIDLTLVPSGTKVCNVYEHESGVSEYVLLAMLEHCWDLGEADRTFRKGDWGRSSRFGGRPAAQLGGRTLGIVGFGHIGREVAERAHAFGMTVLAASRRRPSHAAIARGYEMSDLHGMLAACDVVLVACSLNDRTIGLIAAPEFAAMRSDAFLVNIARGPIVDEEAFYLALKNGRIGGAQIDVWYRYPEANDADQAPSRFDFATLPNVRMTPHIAGWSEATVRKRWEVIAQNVMAALDGGALVNEVR